MSDNYPSIAEYYKNKTILLTGASGFLGKVVLEKLLSACPHLRKIFVLIRAKKGKSPNERLSHILSYPLFSRLQQSQDNFADKVIAINSDLLEDRIGLSEEDRHKIIAETQVVIHAAASVNFSEPLRTAIKVNVVSVDEVIKLCKEMPLIEVLCHVSTAFSNCIRNGEILEKIYPVDIHPQKLIDLISIMPDELMNTVSEPMRKDFPNNYLFTKNSAEYLLQEKCRDFPSCIFRPPLICPSFEEPVPGWIDNYIGIIGLTLMCSAGVVRVAPVSGDMRVTFCPVDHAANALIAVTWKTAIERMKETKVFNFAKTTFTVKEWLQTLYHIAKTYSPERILRAPYVFFVMNKPMFQMWSLIYHWIPAFIIDCLSVIAGYRPWLTQLYKRYNRTAKDFIPFVRYKLQWRHENLDAVAEIMSEEDRNNFPWTLQPSQVNEHGMRWAKGVKQYLLKEDMNNLKKCLQKQQRARVIGWIFWIIVCLSIVYFLVSLLLMPCGEWLSCTHTWKYLYSTIGLALFLTNEN